MSRTSFAPGKTLTIVTIIALAILVALGTWQARKVGPKTAMVERIETGLKGESIKLPVHVDDPLMLDYRKVVFEGTSVPVDPVRVYQINLAGKPGYSIYAPVQRPHGMAVIVNFGWVPMEYDQNVRLPNGEIEVRGVLRTSATPGMMTPENVPEADQWFTADVHELAAHFGLRTKEYYHFRVFADHRGGAEALPRGGEVRVDIPNNHLEYAFTWYGLGLSLIAVYIAFGLKRGRERQS